MEKAEQFEAINKVYLNIIRSLNSIDDMTELIHCIYDSLDSILDTTTVFIALYDHQRDQIIFQYYKDIDDIRVIEKASQSSAITFKVIKSGKPLFLTCRDLEALYAKKRKPFGKKSKVWLGVPLKIMGKTIGTLAVQSYTDPFCYSENDIPLLESIAEFIAFALYRKQKEMDLNESEKKYKYAVEIGEMIRKKIGLAVHDELCPHLIGIQSYCMALKKTIPPIHTELLNGFSKIEALLSDSILMSRALSKGLSPAHFVINGMEQVLIELCTTVENVFKTRCRLFWDNSFIIENEKIQQLYYIIQEAVYNSIKHGRPKNILISVRQNNRENMILIEDDGSGISKELESQAECNQKGMGMKIMMYRAEQINFSISWVRNKIKGTTVRVFSKDQP